MELTREVLLARKQQLLDDLHALDGALQQVDWSLAVLAQSEGGPEEPALVTGEEGELYPDGA